MPVSLQVSMNAWLSKPACGTRCCGYSRSPIHTERVGLLLGSTDDEALRPVIRVIRHPGSGSSHPRGSVLAMGNFDGLHRGHAVLIGRVCDLARAEGRPSGVLTFEPHPRSVFLPSAETFRLTPFRVKERELARLGIDLLFVQHFD